MPDFFIIGAMKSATSTLDEYLRRHPGVFMCVPKEPQYFSRDAVFARGEAWYRGLFSGARPDQLCGEASTCYSRWPRYPEAPARICRSTPDARFVYVVRHPVDRAYSHFGHAMQERLRGGTGPVIPFEQFLQEDREVLAASDYMRQLERYFEFFPRERFCVVVFEDLMRQPAAETERVQRFLGLQVADLCGNGEVVANRRGDALARGRIKRAFRAARSVPGASLLIGAFPQAWRQRARRRMFTWLERSALGRQLSERFRRELPQLVPETRARLLARFESPNRALEAFLGRDLPAWRR